MLSTPDEQHLAFAAREGRVVVTGDQDFLRLAVLGHAHAGIVRVRRPDQVGDTVRALVLIAHASSAAEMVGRVEYF